MGSRGPVPKSRAQLKLTGSRRANYVPDQPDAPVEAPAMPQWLLPHAKTKWREVVPQLIELGVLAKIDRSMLAMWCQAWARHRTLERFLDEHGMTFEIREPSFKDKRGRRRRGAVIGSRVRPEARELDRLRQYLKAGAAEFGLTPSSRTRLAVSSRPQMSKLEQFRQNKAS